MPGSQQLLLEGPEKTFNTAVALRLANECRGRLDSQESELVLEVFAHELGGMIVPQSAPLGSASLKPSEVLMDALAKGFQGLEAGGPPA